VCGFNKESGVHARKQASKVLASGNRELHQRPHKLHAPSQPVCLEVVGKVASEGGTAIVGEEGCWQQLERCIRGVTSACTWPMAILPIAVCQQSV
jgi:hypothetical protein